MKKLSFNQFIHPLSQFPSVVNLQGADEPSLDFYTMASVILYTACANNNRKAKEHLFQVSAANAGKIDFQLLFERCQTGDRAAILQMISLIVSGLESKSERLKPA
ncbi:hypothetical protein [Calothrix sp. 336/3]|uniref:hypothetical protein n=1 Tax=Calothrix sp. 336/3 TaxID=1337936 RepID=UPI0004E4225B|nr:hypothetical protein [Calothrix sp. 336/3]AKG20268.1 hypothetical protein IJ00_02135 [Calothrix sp. 336/3]